MKRILFAMFALLFAVTVSARSYVKVVSGDANWRKSSGTVYVNIDYSSAKWDNDKPVKEFWPAEDWDSYMQKGVSGWNEGMSKSKKANVTTTTNRSSADYVMNVKINNLDRFVDMLLLIPGGTVTKVWCTVTVTDKSGKTVCTYEVDYIQGDADYNVIDSFEKAMKATASEVIKCK